MRKLFIIIQILLILAAIISCDKDDDAEHNIDIPNYKLYEGAIGRSDVSTVVSNDNNLLICGNDYNNFVLKIDKSGNEIWRKSVLKSSQGQLEALMQSSNDNIYISGKKSLDYNSDNTDILIIKTNSIGDTIWTKIYGGEDNELSTHIIETNDGNILVAGYKYNLGQYKYALLLKINYDGDTLWSKVFSDKDMSEVSSLLKTKDGNYLAIGNSYVDNIFQRNYIMLNSDGDILWENEILDTIQKAIYSTIELPNGDLVSTGNSKINANELNQILIIKTDNIGNIKWEMKYGENDLSEYGASIKQNLDGGFCVTGRSDPYATKSDIILLSTDSFGNQLWYKRFGSSKLDIGRNIIIVSNGDIITTGYYNSTTFYDGNIFMVKTDKFGKFK